MAGQEYAHVTDTKPRLREAESHPVSHEARTRSSPGGVQISPRSYLGRPPLQKCHLLRINAKAMRTDFQLRFFLSDIPSHRRAQTRTQISEHVGKSRGDESTVANWEV